ncbi:hypothetical protein LSCM4_05191 [Leishmania orientalis]|uniref:Uncharacterized protein n=1 Tax=Leishmania orientalis TaxID=2249476 RepID=A0A836KKE9_9TRYP|nr:hypothetical protein LSCM4_05191 [Leishmania orientalis]
MQTYGLTRAWLPTMDAWFEYALGISELIYSTKLHEYEEACASLVLKAAEATASAVAAANGETVEARKSGEGRDYDQSGVETTIAHAASWAAPVRPTALMGSTRGSPLLSVDDSAPHAPTPSSVPLVSVSSHGAAAGACAASSATTTLSSACLTHTCSNDQSEMPTPSLWPPAYTPVSSGDSERRALDCGAGAVVSFAGTFEALLDAMQLPNSMRTAASRSEQIDCIQAEADFVFQGLEDAFVLQPGDAAAAAVVAEACVGTSDVPRPSSPLLRSTPTRFESLDNDEERSVAWAHGRPVPSIPAASVADAGEQHLLYGELTSVGVRELQAISMASSCVLRADHTRARSRDSGADESDFPVYPSANSPGALSAPALGPTPPVPRSASDPSLHTGDYGRGHGYTSRGAVVVAVDVGSGNGRLLFEWSRLAAAACRCRYTSPPLRRANEGATSAGAAPAPLTLYSTGSALERVAAAARRGTAEHRRNLLSAAYAPLGITSPATMWLGWLGVGIELVPSRMRIARKALAPYCLNLGQPLPVSAPEGGVPSTVTHLSPCLPEAKSFTRTSASYSTSASLQSTVMSHTTVALSALGSPALTGVSVATEAGCRAPQPSARVLLYEGDALAPGVLSNVTLCRFPNLDGVKPLRLRESYAALETRSEEQNSRAGSSSFPHATNSTAGMPATSASANKACLLKSACSGAHGRGGVQASANMGSASTTNAGRGCPARERAAEQNYYLLCRVEGGPALTGREDPHLVVFCCGLGFDEAQVRRLCQRLEDMLLRRLTTTAATAPPSVEGDPMTYQQLSKDMTSFPSHLARPCHSHGDHGEDVKAAGPTANCALFPLSSPERDKGGGIETQCAMPPSAPTSEDPTIGISTGIDAGFSSHRHWKSVTCVLLLRPMDVLQQAFPLFRYARRIYDTLHQPISAEDTALLLSTGCRADGTPVPFSLRAAPTLEPPPGPSTACGIVESDIWKTTLETTWMSAAPAWVVRFCF